MRTIAVSGIEVLKRWWLEGVCACLAVSLVGQGKSDFTRA